MQKIRLFKTLMLAFMLMLCNVHAIAITPSNGSEGSGGGEEIIIRKKLGPGSNRPKAPSNQYVVMTYDPEEMTCYFHLTASIPYLHVDIQEMNTGVKYSGDIFLDDSYLAASIGKGNYVITCIDGNGDIYQTSFDIE